MFRTYVIQMQFSNQNVKKKKKGEDFNSGLYST